MSEIVQDKKYKIQINEDYMKTQQVIITDPSTEDYGCSFLVDANQRLYVDKDLKVDGDITCNGVLIKNLDGTAVQGSPNADVDIETMNSGIVRIDNQKGGTVSIGALGNADIYIDNMTSGKISVSNITGGIINLSSIEWDVFDDHSKDTNEHKSISYVQSDRVMFPGHFYRIELADITAVWLWDTSMEGGLGFATTLRGGGADQDSMYAIKVWAENGFYDSASKIEFRKVYINIGDGAMENGQAYHKTFTGYRVSRSKLHFDDIKKYHSS